jgi:molybdopterin-guanine dinucleotide biosynthesis protein A
MRLNVAILVGGKGRRIGMEKGLIELNGKKFVEILVERFKDCNVVLVCRDDKQGELYKSICGCEYTTDVVRDFSPLAGIYSALEYFKDYVLVVAVDMPFVRRKLAHFLFEKAKGYDALIPTWGDGKREPLLACYSYKATKTIKKYIEMGIKRVVKPFEELNTLFYPIEELKAYDKNLISFINVNTLEDLEMVKCLSIDLEDL